MLPPEDNGDESRCHCDCNVLPNSPTICILSGECTLQYHYMGTCNSEWQLDMNY